MDSIVDGGGVGGVGGGGDCIELDSMPSMLDPRTPCSSKLATKRFLERARVYEDNDDLREALSNYERGNWTDTNIFIGHQL